MEIPVRHQRLMKALQELGLVVRYRSWAMGDTLLVADCLNESDGIASFDRVVWLCPEDEHKWTMHFMVAGMRSDSHPFSEDEIREQTAKALSSKTNYARQQMHWVAEHRWKKVTNRRCLECASLFPEPRAKCWVCKVVEKVAANEEQNSG